MNPQSKWSMVARLLWVAAGVRIAMGAAMAVVDPMILRCCWPGWEG